MSKKIIIVDDNKTFLMYAGLLLKRFGFRVMPAENGIELLKLLKLTEADVVLLDIYMEHMDGFAVLRHMKNDKQISHIPVIMMSTDASPETVEKCRNLGCFDFLAKPLKIDKLHNTLQMCFFWHLCTNRRHLRTSFNRKVFVKYDGEQYELYADSLSEGGMYIRKEEPFPVGSEVEVKCPLEDRGPLHLKGDVIYTKKLFGDFFTLPPGMAIKFKELTENDATTLKFHIEDVMAKDILEGQEDKAIER
jgi:CheY-like chemotaxis protein/Tfp pilus assembly protein PilZ